MIALGISTVLIIIVWVITLYTTLITKDQFKFLTASSIMYVILFGFVKTLLTSDKSIFSVFTNNQAFWPLIFYIFWYFASASVGNTLTRGDNYQGFFEKSNNTMSERNVMPR